MEMSRIDTVVGAGITELWTVRTPTISRTTSTSTGSVSRSSRPGGSPIPIGWKDTVLLAAGETVQFAD